MRKIAVLDKHTIDKIAAGEVVERPSSAIKELVENAIDAGATAITMEIQKGGMSFMRVTDNGCGFYPEDVKNAFLLEKEMQELGGIHNNVTVDGYQNFIFINRFGGVRHQGSLNNVLRRIIRDCNDKQLLKEKKNPVLLPNFSCHSLRHTFTTRLVEAGVNIKVIQNLCGHSRSDVTLDIYDSNKRIKTGRV